MKNGNRPLSPFYHRWVVGGRESSQRAFGAHVSAILLLIARHQLASVVGSFKNSFSILCVDDKMIFLNSGKAEFSSRSVMGSRWCVPLTLNYCRINFVHSCTRFLFRGPLNEALFEFAAITIRYIVSKFPLNIV